MPQRCDTTLDQYTLKMFRGATCSRAFRYKNPDNTPIDITGIVITLGIKDVFDSTLKLSSGDAPNSYGSFIEVTDAVNGEFRFKITDEQTETALPGTGRWWIEFDNAGDVDLVWRDTIVVDNI